MNWKTKLSKSVRLFYIVACGLAMSAVLPSQTPSPPLNSAQIAAYERQNVSSVELAGRPDLKPDELGELIAQQAGQPFSQEKVDATVAGIKATGRFQDVQVDLRPEPDGLRVVFVLQPAVYFGIYEFSNTGSFSYTRLLQISKYSSPEPYSPVDVQRAETALQTFFRQNGYFECEVESEVHVDSTHGLANVTFHIDLNRLAKFGDVHISGASPEETQRLQDVLRSFLARIRQSSIRPGKKYSLKRLQKATQYLEGNLAKNDRLAARVRLVGADYNPETNRADVMFNVQTGPVVNVKVEGAHLWSWTKRKLLPIYEAGLTPELIQEGRQNLISHFKSNGFFDVTVDTQVQQQPSGESVLYRIEKGPRKKIVDVEFTGNEHLDEDELDERVPVQKARFLSHGKYDDNSVKVLKATYQAAGFNEVRVTPQFTTRDGNVVVTFLIEEGSQDIVESLRIEGNNAFSEKQLAPDGLRLAPGQPYSQKGIDDDRNKIMSHYLEQGYLTASFRENAQPLANDPHRFQVVYSITEGPQVHAGNIVTIGRKHTIPELISRETGGLQPGRPLTERELLSSESRLYTAGVFDWAAVDTRRQITNQSQEDVIVKVHEANRNAITYGLGWEMVNRGGSVPSGTVAVPGLPPIGLPSNFKTSERRFSSPRGSIQYTRSNVRGKAETITIAALAGPLLRRTSFAYTNPHFRLTRWSSNFTASGEINKENPIFNSRIGQLGWQLQRPLNEKQTKNFFLRYSYTETGLSQVLIPELVAPQDRHTRLSTFSANYVLDTRDNILDAHKGTYQSAQLDFNSRALGSSVSFAKVLLQSAYYREVRPGIIWANSLRVGLEQPFGGSHVPLSEKFFTGGGSTLRGFPLNGAGPQNTIPACGDPSDPGSCAFIRVPVGGTQLLIINSELRIPVPIKKGLSFVTFYDGGNVFNRIGFHEFGKNYTNTAGIGLRYATPVGPIRIDIGHNLNGIPGIKATQIFITLGQAF